jgi:hypothetical protein
VGLEGTVKRARPRRRKEWKVPQRQGNGDHLRWTLLGAFALKHGRPFDPDRDNVIGHLSGMMFFSDSPPEEFDVNRIEK